MWRVLIVVGTIAGAAGVIAFLIPGAGSVVRCSDQDYRALFRVAMTLMTVGVACDLVGIWGTGVW